MSFLDRHLTKAVLLAPDAVARAAADGRGDAREAWMLRQPRSIRRDYVRRALNAGDSDDLAEAWMLRQPDAVRESYVREVLELG